MAISTHPQIPETLSTVSTRKVWTLMQPRFRRTRGKNAYVMISDAGYIFPTHLRSLHESFFPRVRRNLGCVRVHTFRVDTVESNRRQDDILSTRAHANSACIHRISIHIVVFSPAN